MDTKDFPKECFEKSLWILCYLYFLLVYVYELYIYINI